MLNVNDADTLLVSNWDKIAKWHLRTAATLADEQEKWHEASLVFVLDWLHGLDTETQWENGESLWVDFFNSLSDDSFWISVDCGCHPRSKCDKCGPVKGKIRGSVYARAAKDDFVLVVEDTK
jgi:hypothetical protein